MPVDKRIELEIALRDSASLTLKAIAKNLEDINRGLAKGGGEKGGGGEDAFKKIKETTESVNKTAEEGAKTVTGLAEGMMPLAATLMRGALARGLLYAEVIKWGTNLVSGAAQERLEWMNMANDTGLSEGFLSMMVQAQKKAGLEEPQAKSNIVNLMSGLQGMSYGHGSPLSQRLSIIGEAVFAREITELMMAGKREEALRAVIARGEERFKEGDVSGRQFADAVGLQPSFFKNMTQLLTTVKPAFEMTEEAAIDWHQGILDTMQWFNNKISTTKNITVKLLNEILSGRMPSEWHPSQSENYGPLTDFLLPAEKMKAWQERSKTTAEILKEILSTYQTHENVQSIEKRQSGGSVLPGRKYLVGEQGPELFRSAAGWEDIIEGPDVFSPKTGGEIIPNRSLGGLFNSMRPWDQKERFGDWTQLPGGGLLPRHPDERHDWTNYRMNEQGILTTRPQLPPGGGPEENWEHLNRALTGPWGSGVGNTEGQILRNDNTEMADEPFLRGLERDMENRLQLPWGNFDPPINQGKKHDIRSLMDSEISGDGGGSLGAEITFKNVPEGVETDADGEGFDSFTVNKTRQLQGA